VVTISLNTSLADAPIGDWPGEEMPMKLALGQSSVCMQRDQLIAMRDARGVRVSCQHGALWITQERSPADVVLEAGQSTVIDTPGLTLVMALSHSTVRLRERASRMSGLRHTLAGWLQAGWLRPGGVH
jgi:hypothetical protein